MKKRNSNLPVDGRNAFDREREVNDEFTSDEDSLKAQLPERRDDSREYETEAPPPDLVDEVVEREEDEEMLSARQASIPVISPA